MILAFLYDYFYDHCDDLVQVMRGGQAVKQDHGKLQTPRSVRRPENEKNDLT